eukprot:m.109509 g.109509  ORF g.109509 m.109509 type:complete len:417 (-) comp14309_c0_seq3:48-1298(-)
MRWSEDLFLLCQQTNMAYSKEHLVDYRLVSVLDGHGFGREYDFLGEGAYGYVYRVNKGEERFAVKHQHSFCHPAMIRSFLREVEALRVLKHENIVKLQAVYPIFQDGKPKDPESVPPQTPTPMLLQAAALVLEPMATNLHKYIHEPQLVAVSEEHAEEHAEGAKRPKTEPKYIKNFIEFTPERVWHIVSSIASALHFMHSGGLVHRDLKPANVLISQNFDVKVCDFGMTRYIGEETAKEDLTGYVVTRYYRPPEVLLEELYGPPMDIWSLGCIVAEMFSRRILFQGDKDKELLSWLQVHKIISLLGTPPPETPFIPAVRTAIDTLPKTPRTEMSTLCPEAAADPTALALLDRIFVYNQATRINAEQILDEFCGDSAPDKPYARLPGPLRFANAPKDPQQLQACALKMFDSPPAQPV